MHRQEVGAARPLIEIETLAEVSQQRDVLAHGGTRVRPAIGPGIEALPAEEVVLDELRIGIEAQRLMIDVPGLA
jgi:hypothetical protein